MHKVTSEKAVPPIIAEGSHDFKVHFTNFPRHILQIKWRLPETGPADVTVVNDCSGAIWHEGMEISQISLDRVDINFASIADYLNPPQAPADVNSVAAILTLLKEPRSQTLSQLLSKLHLTELRVDVHEVRDENALVYRERRPIGAVLTEATFQIPD